MHIITILNQCLKFKSFVFETAKFSRDKSSILVSVRPRKNSKAVCSRCGAPGPCYDKLRERQFEHEPIWKFKVKLVYAMRRVQCPSCEKVIVERVPWGEGKNHFTYHYATLLASWAKDLSWKRVAERFQTSWQTVAACVTWVVTWGLRNREIDNVTSIGVDEVAWQKGHNYLTLVYQVDKGFRRLLWIGEKRTQVTLKQFFKEFEDLSEGFAERIQVVCSDMWKPYLKVIKEKMRQCCQCVGQIPYHADDEQGDR